MSNDHAVTSSCCTEIGAEEDLAPDEDNLTEDTEGVSTGIEPREGAKELVEATPDTKELASGRIQRQGRWKGVDPVLFLKDEKIVESLVNFYGIKESFPLYQHLVVRSEDSTRCKRIYYVSGSVSDTIQLNFRAGEQLKITSAGLKIFVSSYILSQALFQKFQVSSRVIYRRQLRYSTQSFFVRMSFNNALWCVWKSGKTTIEGGGRSMSV